VSRLSDSKSLEALELTDPLQRHPCHLWSERPPSTIPIRLVSSLPTGFPCGNYGPSQRRLCFCSDGKTRRHGLRDFPSPLLCPLRSQVSSGLCDEEIRCLTVTLCSTDLSLLNNGSIWGWTVCVVVVAFVSKFVGCAAMARVFGFDWRESGAVGSLMSCKGYVYCVSRGGFGIYGWRA
jgi:hypothetical protein